MSSRCKSLQNIKTMVNVSKEHLPVHKSFIRAATLERERLRYQQEINTLVTRIKELKTKLDEIDKFQFNTLEAIDLFQRRSSDIDATLAEAGINFVKPQVQKKPQPISAKSLGNTFKIKY